MLDNDKILELDTANLSFYTTHWHTYGQWIDEQIEKQATICHGKNRIES